MLPDAWHPAGSGPTDCGCSSRRAFLESIGALGLSPRLIATSSAPQTTTPEGWRSRFPALGERVNGRPLAYLDNAATTHRPQFVLDAEVAYYRLANANPSPSMHTLARRAFEQYESARRAVAAHINASSADELVFCRGATEAINLVAATWAREHLRRGDEILLSVGEHYSNLLPWQVAAQRADAVLRFIEIEDDGSISIDRVESLLTPRTRLVCVAHASHVLGTVAPVRRICDLAHRVGALVLVDGAQSAPHLEIDVRALGCDFFAFSGHKMLGPMSTGALWARRPLLDEMPPYQLGGHMAASVTLEKSEYAAGAFKFEAGSPNVAGPVAWAAALEFMKNLDWDPLRAHLRQLTEYCAQRLGSVRRLRPIGDHLGPSRIGIFSFVLDGQDPKATVAALDTRGIAVRSGDLAAAPLLRRFKHERAVRASLYIYNDKGDVDRLAEALDHMDV
jgi:cysteine desulfurase/selenocysteine lyase